MLSHKRRKCCSAACAKHESAWPHTPTLQAEAGVHAYRQMRLMDGILTERDDSGSCWRVSNHHSSTRRTERRDVACLFMLVPASSSLSTMVPHHVTVPVLPVFVLLSSCLSKCLSCPACHVKQQNTQDREEAGINKGIMLITLYIRYSNNRQKKGRQNLS